MAELLTAAQMRALESAAMERGEVAGLALMERAGQGATEAALARLRRTPGRALVLCGPGNNGGDGFVIARLLAARGWAVTAYLLGDAGKLPADARRNHDRWAAIGAVHPWDAEAIARSSADLAVDAVFGAGLTRAPDEDVMPPLRGLRDRAFTLAVDAPTGLCMDSGRPLTEMSGADLTVTFHRARPGHHLGAGPKMCGALEIVDIGLDGAPEDAAWLVGPADAAATLKSGEAHKFDHGHALVLTGGAGRTGAARLSARAALRIGAGLVTLGVPPAAQMEVAAQIAALMMRRVADAGALEVVLEDPRLNALCLGPGLGLDARAAALVRSAVDSGRPAVLDADALTLIGQDRGLFAALHEGCVLTPHAGEFARVFPRIAARLKADPERGPAFSRLDAAREAAAASGATVLLKGPDTVIAAPGGAAFVAATVYDRAAPWLATAGAGDVLSGMIAGLLARGFAPPRAAALAAWLHGEAARAFGPGLIAEDLPDTLPSVFAALAQ